MIIKNLRRLTPLCLVVLTACATTPPPAPGICPQLPPPPPEAMIPSTAHYLHASESNLSTLFRSLGVPNTPIQTTPTPSAHDSQPAKMTY